MDKFQVLGADRETGEDCNLIVEADNEFAAEEMARGRGMFIESTKRIAVDPSNQTNLPGTCDERRGVQKGPPLKNDTTSNDLQTCERSTSAFNLNTGTVGLHSSQDLPQSTRANGSKSKYIRKADLTPEQREARDQKTLLRREKALERVRRERLEKKRREILAEHMEALRSKRLHCLNTWGRLEKQDWLKVKEQFVKSVLRVRQADSPKWIREIDLRIGRLTKTVSRIKTIDLGTKFEMEVALNLRALGWTVQLLGKSGDQGGDVLAHKGKKIVVIQCKNHRAKVGNKSVQEVIAGLQFYNATIAAVVCPVGFTRQAQALAAKTGVLLLSVEQLSFLD